MEKNQKEIRMSEIRASNISDEEKMIIEGYAIVFESPATHYGFTETIARGALDGAEMKDVPLRYNHNDTWLVIARTRNKSLQLKVDEKGLFIRAELIDTQTNRDIYKSIKAGLIDKMSFAFTTKEDVWEYDEKNDDSKRTVTKIEKLFDVSVVDTPFYEETEIYARALSELDSHKKSLDSEKRAVEVEKIRTQILNNY